MISLSSLQHPQELATQIASVELFVIPRELLTRTTILPEKIESFSRVEKRTLTEASDLQAFFAALEASAPTMGRDASEFRIKAVLLDAAGARVAEIYAAYLTRFGLLGEDRYLTFATEAFAAYVTGAVKTTGVS